MRPLSHILPHSDLFLNRALKFYGIWCWQRPPASVRIPQKIKTIKGRNDTSGTKTSRLGGGGQSVVYKCETNDESSDLSKVVIKMYLRPWEV